MVVAEATEPPRKSASSHEPDPTLLPVAGPCGRWPRLPAYPGCGDRGRRPPGGRGAPAATAPRTDLPAVPAGGRARQPCWLARTGGDLGRPSAQAGEADARL